LVFLNDDTEVEAGWLEALVEVADSDSRAGAVGSCVLFPDGSVQEAGSIVWRDGSITAYGRGADPDTASVSFVRQVDYCSACSLLVRREAWTAVGGFCEDYFPAYYEDVELCLAMRELGYRVLYCPHSRVKHVGGSSTDPKFRKFLNEHQRRRFRQRWESLLSRLEAPRPDSPAALRRAAFRANGSLRRVMIIADAVLFDAADSGLHDAAVELSATDHAVSVWASGHPSEALRQLGRHGVEAICGDVTEHLSDPGVLYDVVLIAAPRDFQRYEVLVRKSQPHSAIVDAERIDRSRTRRDGGWVDTLRRAQFARAHICRSSA
jgi:hypothetical protein